MKREETNDIFQYLIPQLEMVGLSIRNCKIDVTTDASGQLRGDVWISTEKQDNIKYYEKNIIALIEAKPKKTLIDDFDWIDAKHQGQIKAKKQGLSTFFVSNTTDLHRCYNVADLSEISLDGKLLNHIPPISILRAIQTQIGAGKVNVIYSSFSSVPPPDQRAFRKSLWNLRQIYRSQGISRGSEVAMVKSTLTFCILKMVTEKQKLFRTIPKNILLWDDWRKEQMDRDIKNCIEDLTNLKEYSHLKGCLLIDDRLNRNCCLKILQELNYTLYGCDFDFFGPIYEFYADKKTKRDFGEFYTPRHIVRAMVKLLLSDEKLPRQLEICDPACGTGGFLVEAFLFLKRNYDESGMLDDDSLTALKESIFWGFDNNKDVAIPYARTNMMMAGDGGINIKYTIDSLMTLPKDRFDYIITNVPMGQYLGNADINTFEYTNFRIFDLLFIERIVKALKPGRGKAAVIVSDALVETTNYSDFRKRFLLDVNLEAVISLPNFVFEPYSTEKTYILFFSKKKSEEIGTFQESPIWHYIVDSDGYQGGKKRFPIFDDDLPKLENSYCSLELETKAGFVNINDISEDNFYSLCSEFYLRKPKIYELSINKYTELLDDIEKFISSWQI